MNDADGRIRDTFQSKLEEERASHREELERSESAVKEAFESAGKQVSVISESPAAKDPYLADLDLNLINAQSANLQDQDAVNDQLAQLLVLPEINKLNVIRDLQNLSL